MAQCLPTFWISGSLKARKCALQDLLLSQITPRKLNFALSLRKCSWISTKHNKRILIMNKLISIIIPQHFSWFKNYKLHWFSNSFLMLLSLVPKQLLLLTQIKIWRWRWWTGATHAPNFIISCQDFHIEFIKSVIDMKNS